MSHQVITLEPTFKTNSDFVKAELNTVLTLIVRYQATIEIFLVFSPEAISFRDYDGELESSIICLNYGPSAGDIREFEATLTNFVHIFEDWFHEENINSKAIRNFISQHKRRKLEDKNSKGLAVETIVLNTSSIRENSGFYYIDFVGDELSFTNVLKDFIVLGGYGNPKTNLISEWLKTECKQLNSPPEEKIILKKLEDLFPKPKNQISAMTFAFQVRTKPESDPESETTIGNVFDLSRSKPEGDEQETK